MRSRAESRCGKAFRPTETGSIALAAASKNHVNAKQLSPIFLANAQPEF